MGRLARANWHGPVDAGQLLRDGWYGPARARQSVRNSRFKSGVQSVRGKIFPFYIFVLIIFLCETGR